MARTGRPVGTLSSKRYEAPFAVEGYALDAHALRWLRWAEDAPGWSHVKMAKRYNLSERQLREVLAAIL